MFSDTIHKFNQVNHLIEDDIRKIRVCMNKIIVVRGRDGRFRDGFSIFLRLLQYRDGHKEIGQ